MTASDKQLIWKKRFWNLGGTALFVIWLWYAGLSAVTLDDTVIFAVGLITFAISSVISLIWPTSKKDIVRVARVTGDVGAASLILASYKHLNGYPFGLSETFIGVCAITIYIIVACRIFRDI